MSDEMPDDERAEEARIAESWSDEPVTDPEAPDADAREQRQSLDPPTGTRPASLDPEVPEADALEQAAIVDGSADEDYEPGPADADEPD